ncbi:MAG: hypothetical protein ACRELV_12355 [Longimicrobiales bacterium]
MLGCLGGCLGRSLAALLLLGLFVLAWFQRERIMAVADRLTSGAAVEETPSPALAERAEQKLASLSLDSPPPRVAFSEAEVQSLVQYRIGHALPPYLLDPKISIEDARMQVDARVPTEAMPDLPGAGEFASLLPDTTDVTAHATMLPLDSGRVALAVGEMSAAKIPLPARMIPSLLGRIGRTDEIGLPDDAIPLRLPAGACTAYLRADSLVLVAATAGSCH